MKNNKPIIGLFPQYDIQGKNIRMQREYMIELERLGAIPVILPLYNKIEDIKCLIEMFDGFIVAGGPDILPAYYNEEPIPENGAIIPERDALELAAIPIIAEAKKPLLGICRGIQSINVALGGTLIQDIPSQTQPGVRVAHDQKSDHDVLTHSVRVKSKSLLGSIIGTDEIRVNSYHHQAIKKLGANLTETAWAKDGIVEGIELEGHPFFIGIQWHPEWLIETSEEAAKIFAAFVEAAKRG